MISRLLKNRQRASRETSDYEDNKWVGRFKLWVLLVKICNAASFFFIEEGG